MKPTMMKFLIGLLLIMTAGLGWLTFDWYRGQAAGDPYGAPFTLVDQNGEVITEQMLRGHPSALFFGFTHCPEVCPTTLYELDGWLRALGPEGEDVKAFFVTVDPERDTPEVLGTYISNVSDRILGISGDPELVITMVKDFHIFARRVDQEDGEYTMDHSASVILLDRQGVFFGTIAYGESSENAIGKLQRLVDS